MRYVNLTELITLVMISPTVKKRFPTLDHLVEAGKDWRSHGGQNAVLFAFFWKVLLFFFSVFFFLFLVFLCFLLFSYSFFFLCILDVFFSRGVFFQVYFVLCIFSVYFFLVYFFRYFFFSWCNFFCIFVV